VSVIFILFIYLFKLFFFFTHYNFLSVLVQFLPEPTVLIGYRIYIC